MSELRSLRRLVADMQETPTSSDDDHRYGHLVQFLPDAVRISCDGIIVYANDATIRLFGARSSDWRRSDDFVPPDERKRIVERRRKLQATCAVPMEKQRRLRLDGSVVDIEVLGISV